MRITIRKKLIFGYLIAVLLMAVFALYAVHEGQQSLKESIGRNSIFLAAEILKRINHDISTILDNIRVYALGILVNKTISESNQVFQKLKNAQEFIKQKDAEWVAAPKGEITPFMQQLINNELSHQLRQKFIQFRVKQQGYTYFAEVLVTNKYGANAAQTGKTSDYYQADEKWWQISRKKGYYIGNIEYYESAQAFIIPFAVRLDDEQGNLLGIIKAAVSIVTITREAEIATRVYETTDIKLICQQRKNLIYATKVFQLLEDVSGKEFFKKITGEEGFFVAKEGKRKRLFSYAHSKGSERFEELNWVLMVAHDTSEVFHAAFVLRINIIAVSLILIAVSILIAFFITHSITKPAAELSKGVEIIGKGNLKHRVKVKTRDELGMLAASFNQMTKDLSIVTASRDELNQEIVNRKKAEKQLKASEEFSSSLLNNSPNPIIGINPDTSIDYVNPSLERLTGFSAEELKGKKAPYPFWRKEKRKVILSDLKAAMQKGAQGFEEEFRKKSGEHFWVEITSLPIFQKRKFVYYIANWVDITNRKQMEDELVQHRKHLEEMLRERTKRVLEVEHLNRDMEKLMVDLRASNETLEGKSRELEAANKELEAFTYSVSHDLRAPLRAISGFAQIISKRHRSSLNKEGRHYFDNIVQASAHMGTLIDDLLEYARVGRKGVQFQQVSLKDSITQVLGILSDQITEADAQISLPEEMPTIQADKTLLEQIFSNLIGNALIYHRPDVTPHITVSSQKENSHIIVTVSDNGIGIPPEFQDKIFTIFQRLHGQDEYPGTGIGLSVVKKSVKLLGGQVWVQSEEGEGSTFYVRLKLNN